MRDVLVVAATERELECAAGARTLTCGIGPVEAAASTARELAERRPDTLLHVGLAGARGLPPGTLVVGSEAVYCDVLAAVPVPRSVEPDRGLLEAVRATVEDVVVRPIGTSARVGGSTGYDVEAMEGFAVLRAAQLAGVPAIEVRAVSNEIDERDRGRWRFEDGFAALDAALPRLVAALAFAS